MEIQMVIHRSETSSGCCCSNRSVSVAVAWVSTVFSVLYYLFIILSTILIYTVLKDHPTDEETKKTLPLFFDTLIIFVILQLFLLAVPVVLSILLTIGVHREKPLFMFPWILSSTLGLIISIVWTVLKFFLGYHIFSVLIELMLLALFGYLTLIVYRHYNEIKMGGVNCRGVIYSDEHGFPPPNSMTCNNKSNDIHSNLNQ